MAGADLDADALEAGAQVGAGDLHRRVGQLEAALAGGEGQRHAEAGREGGQEQLRGRRARVVPPVLGRLVGADREAPHLRAHPEPALPAGGNLQLSHGRPR